VPVYKFNSNNLFSPDIDRKRPLATIALCSTTTMKASNLAFIYRQGK